MGELSENLWREFKKSESIYEKENFKLFSTIRKVGWKSARKISIEAILEENARRDIKIITGNDKEYPNELKHIIDYPLFLYVKGNLENLENAEKKI